MLGETFFNIGHEMAKAPSFDRVADLLGEEFRRSIGALDVIIVEVAENLSAARIIGNGPISDSLRHDPAGAKRWIEERVGRLHKDSCELCGGPTDEEKAAFPELAGWLSQHGISDIVGGSLVLGAFRSACLAAFKKDGAFSEEELERLRAMVLVTRSVLSRLVMDRYERRVLERLMNMRNETTNAVIFLKGNRAVPYNPGAVAYADACWEKDEVEFRLSEVSMKAVHDAVSGAWVSPVDCAWVDVDVDLGGGLLKVGAIVHPDQGVLLYFTPPPRQSFSGGTVPMLTRRQCDIMDWIAEGKTSAEVAIILEISPRTVEKHLEAVFQRFGVENRVAAVRTYLEAKGGLLPGQGA